MSKKKKIKRLERENAELYEKPKRLYVCDPIKNNWCGKHSCFKNGGDCRLTIFKEYAMTDENGNAIKEGENND